MSIIKKVVPTLIGATIMLNASLVDSIKSSSCAKVISSGNKSVQTEIEQGIMTSSYGITPMCSNIQRYLNKADSSEGFAKFANIAKAQIDIDRIKLYSKTDVQSIESAIEEFIYNANTRLVKDGYINASETDVVAIELDNKGRNYIVMRLKSDSKKGFNVQNEKMDKDSLIKLYPTIAKSYGIKVDVAKEFNKETSINKHDRQFSATVKIDSSTTYTVNVKTLRCRKNAELRHGKEDNTLEFLTRDDIITPALINGNPIMTSGFIFATSQKCWVVEKYLKKKELIDNKLKSKPMVQISPFETKNSLSDIL